MPSGFDNDTAFFLKADTRGVSPVVNQMTDGKILIGRTTADANGSHISAASLTGGNNVTITPGAGSITISSTDLHVAKWIVNPTANSGGNQTTIQAAIDAAVSGEDIFVMPGTYTENLTLKAGVNITGFPCDGINNEASTANVTIVGKCSFTTAGTVTLANLRLQTNGDYALAVTGSAASLLNVSNCDFRSTNNTAINITSGNARVLFENCTGDITALTYAVFAVTAGVVKFRYCRFENSINSLAANTNSGADLSAKYCVFRNRYETSAGGNFSFNFTSIECLLLNTAIPITAAGTGTNTLYQCQLLAGTVECIALGAGTTTYILQCIFQNNNTNDITGAGSVHYGIVTARDDGTVITNTATTQVANYTELGCWTARGQPAFSAFLGTTASNVTGNGAGYILGDTDTGVALTEIFDQNSNFNPGSASGALFTAPVTGRYLLSSGFNVQEISTATNFDFTIVTSNRIWRGFQVDPSAVDVSGTIQFNMTVFVDMDAGDTADTRVNFSGMAGNTGDVFGGATDPRTWFSGHLVA